MLIKSIDFTSPNISLLRIYHCYKRFIIFQGFPAPPSTDLIGYHAYIDEAIPPESPYLYGLHPNAEVGFLTMTAENLFKTVFEMQPRDTGSSGGQTVTREDKVIIFFKAIGSPCCGTLG